MTNDVLAWAVIGAAASIVGMIYPFRRGATGVIVTMASSVLGSTLLGLMGWLLVPGSPHERRVASLAFAAAGAIAAVLLLHGAYSRWHGWRHAPAHRSPRGPGRR